MITNRNTCIQYDFCDDMVTFQINSPCHYRCDEIVKFFGAYRTLFFSTNMVFNMKIMHSTCCLDINYQYFFLQQHYSPGNASMVQNVRAVDGH